MSTAEKLRLQKWLREKSVKELDRLEREAVAIIRRAKIRSLGSDEKRDRAAKGKKMPQRLLSALLFLLCSGCATPSTMMVNREGRVYRCAWVGWGNLITITTAEQAHDGCVRDMRKVGYISVPELRIGIDTDWRRDPPVVKGVDGAAERAGIRVGDIVVQIDDVKPKSDYDVYVLLEKKRRGDSVKIQVKRDDQMMTFAPIPTLR